MKKYYIKATHANGNIFEYNPYKQLKATVRAIENIKINSLVKSIELRTESFGENEHAGEFSVKNEVVFTK